MIAYNLVARVWLLEFVYTFSLYLHQCRTLPDLEL